MSDIKLSTEIKELAESLNGYDEIELSKKVRWYGERVEELEDRVEEFTLEVLELVEDRAGEDI